MVNMGQSPIPHLLLSWDSAGRKALAFPAFGRGRERAMVNMGQSPIPLHYYHGVVRGESVCGKQSLWEHALSGKPDGDGACWAERLCRSIIRV